MIDVTMHQRLRTALVAFALALPLLWAGILLAATGWVHQHGGLAASITHVARDVARVASRTAAAASPAVATADQGDAISCSTSGYVWSGDEPQDFSFALIEPGKGSTVCFDMNSSSDAIARLSRSTSEPAVWFRRGGDEYVIHDAPTVDRARELCRPLVDLGRQMGEVGARQGRIGAQLGEMGGRLGQLGGRLGALSTRLASEDLRSSERADIRREIDTIQPEMQRLSREMRTREGASHDDMAELGSRMREYSRQHRDTLKQVRGELRQLLDQALREGKAQKLGVGA